METSALMLFFFGACFYLLPSIISVVRGTSHGVAIRLINIFFGWTVLGWIAALIWSIAEKPERISRAGQKSTWSTPFYEQ